MTATHNMLAAPDNNDERRLDPMIGKQGSVDLVFLVHRELMWPILYSQVFKPLSLLGEDVRSQVVISTPLGQFIRPSARNRLLKHNREVETDLGVRVSHIPSPPSRFAGLWNDAIALRRWLDRRYPGDVPVVIRCRNAQATLLALDVRRTRPHVRVIYDCRSSVPAAMLHPLGLDERNPEAWPSQVRKTWKREQAAERRATAESDHIIAISKAMQSHLQAGVNVPDGKFTIIPCCVDIDSFDVDQAERLRTRQELGFGDRFVVSYCGAIESYHLPHELIRIFKLIKEVRQDALFFAVTVHEQRILRIIEAAGLSQDDVRVVSVPSPQVPRMLAVADMGVMFRDQTSADRISSPVKFAEYLASGTPVLLTPNQGDFSELSDRTGVGMTIDLQQPEAAIRSALQSWITNRSLFESLPERCRALARHELSWSAHHQKFKNVLRELVSQAPLRR